MSCLNVKGSLVPVDLYLNFEKSSWKNQGYTGSKNQVRNKLKIRFVKLDFSEIKHKSTGGLLPVNFFKTRWIMARLCIFFLGNAIEPIKELLRSFISWFFASWIQNFRWNSTAKWQFSGGFGNLIMPIANAIDTTNQAIKAIFFISRLPWRITAVCTVVLRVLLNGILFGILFQFSKKTFWKFKNEDW